MSKIPITLIDMAGYQATLPLPEEKLLTALVPAIVTLLDLSQGYNYCLFAPRLQRVLSMTGTLYSNGVLPEDVLRVVPAPASRALEFELLNEPSPNTRIAIPDQPVVSIGRGSENDIVIRHAAISRQHGEMIWQDGIHVYRDLNSANGSYINNQIVSEPMPISPGSILGLGENVRLVYQEVSPEDETAASASHASFYQQMALDTGHVTSLNPIPRGIIYISYDADQSAPVGRLAEHLRKANFHIFWDQEIPPGTNMTEAVASGLRLADVMLIMLTPEALDTQDLIDQWHEFLLQRKPIVVAQMVPGETPENFAMYPKVEFHGDFNQFSQDVIVALLQVMR